MLGPRLRRFTGGKHSQNSSVRGSQNLLFQRSNENTEEMVKINIFRTLEINQRFETIQSVYSRKMAPSQQEQWALSHFNVIGLIVSFPCLFPQLWTGSIAIIVAMKASRLAVIVWGRMCLGYVWGKLYPQSVVAIWLVRQLPAKASSQGLSLFDLTQRLFSEILYLQSVCQKQSEQLFNITFTWCGLVPVGQIRGWPKSLTLVNRMSAGSIEKLWHIPGDLEDQMRT